MALLSGEIMSEFKIGDLLYVGGWLPVVGLIYRQGTVRDPRLHVKWQETHRGPDIFHPSRLRNRMKNHGWKHYKVKA